MNAEPRAGWPGLIIFDCDGVLIDSEVIAARIEAESLSEAGFRITAEEIQRDFIGIASATCHGILERRYGRALPPDFGETLRLRTRRAFEAELRIIPGVHDAIERFSGIPRCVASSSDADRLTQCLGLVGLAGCFGPHVFSAGAVAHGKPAPDLFLHATSRMGVEPGRCLVVEDSLVGVRAGVAAGMTVIGFVGGSHCPPGHAEILARAGAVAVIGEMADLTLAVAERHPAAR